MSVKKIIACLDVLNGRVVKGVHFVDFIDAGDPVECAKFYESEGVSELVFLDISATVEERRTVVEAVKKVAESIEIPLTVGGGIASLSDMERLFQAGASKVSINSAAVKNPDLIREASEKFGKEKIVVAIDAKKNEQYEVYINGGQKNTNISMIEWAKQVETLGAGAILLTSIDTDGMKQGFDIPMLRACTEAVSIPVVASGGAGKIEDFYEVLSQTDVKSALGAGVFHNKSVSIKELISFLKSKGIEVA